MSGHLFYQSISIESKILSNEDIIAVQRFSYFINYGTVHICFKFHYKFDRRKRRSG